MEYRKKVLKGIGWMGGLKGVTRIITFCKLAILARLLTPSEFGLFGIATLALALLETLTDTGINVFFIQKEGEIKDYINTAWIVSMVRGFLITAILILLSIQIADFFGSPNARILIIIIAIAAFLRGFINPAIVVFQKNLEFNKEFLLRFSSVLAETVVSVSIGIATKSAVALVWGMVASVIVEMIISFLFIKPRPKLVFESIKIKKVLNRGKWVTAAGLFQYLFSNGDNIIVARLMNTNFLGFYQMAYRISTIPLTEISDVFSKVTFPVYANIISDKLALKDTFIKSLVGIFIITFPIGLVFLVFTKPLVEILLGYGWLEIVPALRVLSIFGVIRAIEGSTTPLFLAIKKQEYVSGLTFISLVGLLITIIPLVRMYGILGASYSALFGAIIVIPVLIIYLYKVFK